MKSLFKKQTEPFIYHKYYLIAQRRWAEKMNSLTSTLPRKTLVYILVLFTFLSSGYLIYNLYTSFQGGDDLSKNVRGISKIKNINLKK